MVLNRFGAIDSCPPLFRNFQQFFRWTRKATNVVEQLSRGSVRALIISPTSAKRTGVLPDESSHPRKNICLSENRKPCSNPHIPRSTHEGVSRSSRHVVRDAVDASGAQTNALGSRTVKPCGPDPPTLGSSIADDDRQMRRGLTSPAPRGDHGAAVKPLRRECRTVRPTLSDYAGVVFSFPPPAAGAACTRHSLLPPYFEGRRI
jgi:hypothetical protein